MDANKIRLPLHCVSGPYAVLRLFNSQMPVSFVECIRLEFKRLFSVQSIVTRQIHFSVRYDMDL